MALEGVAPLPEPVVDACQGYDTVADKEALFVERVESLISRENTLWITTHEKEESTKRK